MSLIKHLGLSGSDGNLSHTKTFGYAVLIAYSFCSAIPASVAITLIVSAHGTKAVMELIRSKSLSLRASDSLSVNKTEIHTIEERKGWNSEREYQES